MGASRKRIGLAGLLDGGKNAIVALVYYTLSPFWVSLWPPMQIVYLVAKRELLRARNVGDVALVPTSEITEAGTPDSARTFEGSFNNPEKPTMAMHGCPFSRNIPPVAATDAPVTAGPDIVSVSDQVLARPPGQGAKTRPLVNLLGGAWIQFMTHDWFQVSKDKSAKAATWPLPRLGGRKMSLQPAEQQDDELINNSDHWWSGSQIYGDSKAVNGPLRAGVDGKMALGKDGKYLPLDAGGLEMVGFAQNLWSGITLLHYLFVLEHNSVCDMLKASHPDWDDERLFNTARLIIAALIARVHTVDWTTAIIQNPAGRAAQYTLWYGLVGSLVGRRLKWLRRMTRRLGFLSELLFGIPGGDITLAADKPFAHSNEFVSVYRMHALLPDSIDVRDARTGAVRSTVQLQDVLFNKSAGVNTTVPLPDLLFSLGSGHAGDLTTNNYPDALRALRTPEGTLVDLAATDVYRVREARLPLFNAFRKALALPRYKTFEALAEDPAMRPVLAGLYNNDVDEVDTMVGLLAERKLPGFVFGESIYSIFVLQTQRRLESDRFFTKDLRDEVYTKEGLEWVECTSMSDILRRHVPELAMHLEPDDNAFIPWEKTGKRKLFEKVLWDVLFPGTVSRWMRDPR